MTKLGDARTMADFPQTVSHQTDRRQPEAFQFHKRKRCFDREYREECQTLDRPEVLRLIQPLLILI